MKEQKNIYVIAIEFEPNIKYNRQSYILASTFESAKQKMLEEDGKLSENEKIRCITLIAENVIY